MLRHKIFQTPVYNVPLQNVLRAINFCSGLNRCLLTRYNEPLHEILLNRNFRLDRYKQKALAIELYMHIEDLNTCEDHIVVDVTKIGMLYQR